MTQRLVPYIARHALVRMFADVAKDVGVDVQTVRGVFLRFPDKEIVEVVAMDLHQGLVHAIGRHMPQAVRVADRYHVARLAQNAFGKAHVETRNRCRPANA